MSYHSLLYHLVIRTYKSQCTITEKYEKDLYAYLYGFMKNKHVFVHRIGGMPDHVHMLIGIPPTICISDFVGELKRTSCIYMQSERRKFPYFEGWSTSYGIFSYSVDDKEKIKRYICNQKVHHQKVSLEDELRQLLLECGVIYDEKYFLKD